MTPARQSAASAVRCGEGGYLPLQKAGLSQLPLSLYLHNPRALSSTLGNCLTLRLKGTALSSVLYRYLALLQHNAFQWQTISGAGLSNPVWSELAIHSRVAYGNVLICCVRTCVVMKALLCSFVSLVSKVSSCTTERRVFFVTRKVLGNCQKSAGNVYPRYCVM